jgi:hypothetical protein
MNMRTFWMMVIHQNTFLGFQIDENKSVLYPVGILSCLFDLVNRHFQNVTLLNTRFMPVNERSFHIILV